MDDFFSRLKQEREDKGKTLEDIFQLTRISLVYLRAIEDGELKRLPKGYDRIFMKSYLMAIGTDVDEFLEEFDRLLGRREPTQVIDLDNLERDALKKNIILNQNVKHALLWTPVAIIVGFLIYLFFTYGGDNNGTAELDGNIPEIKVEDYINSIDTNQQAIEAPADEMPNDSLYLQLTGRERTWVRSIVDHKDTVEFILNRNTTKDIKADSVITFLIGKGNGITLRYRDSLYQNLTPPGHVIKRMEVDRNGIRKLIYTLPLNKKNNQ